MGVFYAIYDKTFNYLNSSEFLTVFTSNRFYMILLVVILMRLKYATYRSMWGSALINIPGTLLHELMHFVVGGLFNARPCNFTIFPKKDVDGSYIMGSVGFRNISFYNAIPAALAPLLLLPISFYLNRYWLPNLTPSLFGYTFYVLIQTIIIENSIPSRTDFKVAGMYWSGIILYSILFVTFLIWL